jgi:group I intron endonuclease
MTALVYTATRRETGDQYVGITSQDLRQRWAAHCCQAKGVKTGRHFHNALRKYGENAFDVQVVAQLPTMQEAQIAERILIACVQPRYNCTAGGEGTVGWKAPESFRRACAERMRGTKWSLGHIHSPETRAKMRASARGKRKSEAHRAKIGQAHVGKKRSPEARKNMQRAQVLRRAAQKGLVQLWDV